MRRPATALLLAILASAPLAGPVAAETAPGGHAPQPRRPRFEVAVGLGVSRDATGLDPARTASVPAFFAMAGFGGGRLGLDLALVATEALGRFRSEEMPVDRLAGEALAIVRPAAFFVAERASWSARVARSVSLAFGPAYERVTSGRPSGGRVGLRVGGHADLPLSPAGPSGDLRLRLGVRRFLGFGRVMLASHPVGDSEIELFGALAVQF